MDKEFSFEWDLEKEKINIHKHGIDFVTASKAFIDTRRKIFIDSKHRKTIILFRQSQRQNIDCKVYLSRRNNSDHRGRFLERRRITL